MTRTVVLSSVVMEGLAFNNAGGLYESRAGWAIRWRRGELSEVYCPGCRRWRQLAESFSIEVPLCDGCLGTFLELFDE